MAIIRVFINDLPIIAVGEISFPDSLQPGNSFSISFYGNPPAQYGELKIVGETGVIARGIVKAFTQQILAGRILNTYTVIDYSALLELAPIDQRFTGKLVDVISRAIDAAEIDIHAIYSTSPEALDADIDITLIGETLMQGLPKILAATQRPLQFTILLTGELKIYEYGYGATPPFQYISRIGTLIKTANQIIYKEQKISPLNPECGYIEIRGRNWQLANPATGGTGGDIIVTKDAQQGVNYYSDFPPDHDLASGYLKLEMFVTATGAQFDLVVSDNPVDFTATFLYTPPAPAPTSLTTGRTQSFTASGGDPALAGAVLTLMYGGATIPTDGTVVPLAVPGFNVTIQFSGDIIVGGSAATAQITINSLGEANTDIPLLFTGIASQDGVMATAEVSFICHVAYSIAADTGGGGL